MEIGCRATVTHVSGKVFRMLYEGKEKKFWLEKLMSEGKFMPKRGISLQGRRFRSEFNPQQTEIGWLM